MYYQRPPTGLASVTDWMAYGHLGVAVFIVLSGYSLAIAVVRNDGRLTNGTKQFLVRRAWRIVPSYYAALALSLVLIAVLIGDRTGTVWDVSIPVTAKGFLAHLLLLQDVANSVQINHPLWTIAVEAQLYLTFPLLIVCRRRLGWPAVLGASVLVGYLGMAVLDGTSYAAVSPQLFTLFVFGYCAAELSFDAGPPSRERVPWLSGGAVLCAIALVGLGVVAPIAHLDREVWLDIPFGAGVAMVLVGMARRSDGRLRSALDWKPLVAVGLFSYSLYLIHAPLEQVLWQYAIDPMGLSQGAQLALMIAVGLPVVVACAYVFYRAVERPSMTMRDRAARNEELAAA